MQKHSDVVLNQNGRPKAGLRIVVDPYVANAAPNLTATSEATIYATEGGAAVPFVLTDAAGRFSFYAADGRYSLTVTGADILPYMLADVTLNDPADEVALRADLDALMNASSDKHFLVDQDDLIPDLHLKRFLSKTNPVVVMVGDSIGTDTADTIGRTESLWSLLREKLTHAYPNKTITFVNRAIGGETYFTAVGLPVGFPTWYTDHARAWPLYVGDLSPDLVIFNFGMNDENAFQSSTLYNYENLLSNAGVFPAGKPDVIYCSNLTPSLVSTIANMNTKAAQDGRHFVAGYTRSWARSKGYGLIDFHRMGSIVKDGFDPTTTSLKRIGSVTPVAGAVAGTVACTDFKWVLSVSTITAAQPLAVKLAAEEVTDSVGRGAFAVLSVSNGKIVVDLYDRPGNIYAGLVSTVTAPAGAFTLTVEKKQQTLIVLINDQEAVSYSRLRVHGKDFTPRVGDATYQGGNITAATFYAGEYKRYRPSLTNEELWGESTADVSMKLPYGGNGVNHLSSRGVASIFKPVLDGTMLGASAAASAQVANLVLLNGWTQLAGFVRSMVVRTGNQTTIILHIVPPQDGATGIICNLPEIYRPPANISTFVPLQTGNLLAARAQIDPNGDVRVINGGNGYLDGCFTYPN